jgi:hypothetical protein
MALHRAELLPGFKVHQQCLPIEHLCNAYNFPCQALFIINFIVYFLNEIHKICRALVSPEVILEGREDLYGLFSYGRRLQPLL